MNMSLVMAPELHNTVGRVLVSELISWAIFRRKSCLFHCQTSIESMWNAENRRETEEKKNIYITKQSDP